jgi:UDP-2,4-diacetamido-2,4,6-trideoxy-beta-L-altropyranose hydrolase
MQDIFIRADAGAAIGLGHVVRCMALADMLKDNFSISFFCKELPAAITSEIRQQGFGLQTIESENIFFNCIDDKKIVVTDGYGFDSSYQKKIKANGAKLVCIDDLHDKDFFADLIINHAPGVSSKEYKAQPYTKFALGAEYALLRSPFLIAAKNKRPVIKIETLLICFGGADSKNLTHKALTAASSIASIKKINIVGGAAYVHSNTLSALLQNDKRIQLHQSLNEMEMLAVMQQSDAAIVPASGILFETLAAGCIPFSGYYIDNQMSIYNGFKSLNAIEDFGDFENIESMLAEKINNPSVLAQNVIDGLSGTRLLTIFKQLSQHLQN